MVVYIALYNGLSVTIIELRVIALHLSSQLRKAESLPPSCSWRRTYNDISFWRLPNISRSYLRAAPGG